MGSSRGLTPEQDEFNDYIQNFENYSRFDRYDFKNNEQLQEMLTLFIEAKTQAKTPEETLPYVFKILDILEVLPIKINTFKYKGKLLHGFFMKTRFCIDDMPTAISIYDSAYLDGSYNEAFYIKTNYIKEEEKLKEDKNSRAMARSKAKKLKIKNSIEEWHQYCIAVNEAKAFIYKRYEKWEGFDKEERKEAFNELKTLAQQLQEFSSCSVAFTTLEEIANSRTKLNTFRELKVQKLLGFNLPQIDTPAIARKITDNLLPPYL